MNGGLHRTSSRRPDGPSRLRTGYVRCELGWANGPSEAPGDGASDRRDNTRVLSCRPSGWVQPFGSCLDAEHAVLVPIIMIRMQSTRWLESGKSDSSTTVQRNIECGSSEAALRLVQAIACIGSRIWFGAWLLQRRGVPVPRPLFCNHSGWVARSETFNREIASPPLQPT